MLDNKAGEQKLYNLFGLSSLVFALLLAQSILEAGTFAEFKKVQTEAFVEYTNKYDKAFSKQLKSNWEEYLAKKPLSLYEFPKPVSVVSTRKRSVKKLGPIVHLNYKGEKEDQNTTSDSNVFRVVFQADSSEINNDIVFDFFGSDVGFEIPEKLRTVEFYPQSQKGISNFFNSVVSLEYEDLVEAIKKKSKELGLNDWGKYLLVKKISENVYSSSNDAELLTWFIFNKLGYSVRVGLANKQVIVMYNSQKIIYDTPRYTIGNKRFYVISSYAKGRIGKLYTYKEDYPEAKKVFDLELVNLPKLKKDIRSKKLKFKQYGNEYEVSYSYNQNLIDFMATYPQADYETFFNAPMEEKSYEDIANGLRKYINGKSSSEAMNFVLHFVQNAFGYQVDAAQFSREKVMFAQETLYYDKSDCEDRAILFAYLTKKLFKVGVVGVKYGDHMATALYIPINGDSVKVNSRKFVIADPTYINSNIGQSMQKYKYKRPKGFVYLDKI